MEAMGTVDPSSMASIDHGSEIINHIQSHIETHKANLAHIIESCNNINTILQRISLPPQTNPQTPLPSLPLPVSDNPLPPPPPLVTETLPVPSTYLQHTQNTESSIPLAEPIINPPLPLDREVLQDSDRGMIKHQIITAMRTGSTSESNSTSANPPSTGSSGSFFNNLAYNDPPTSSPTRTFLSQDRTTNSPSRSINSPQNIISNPSLPLPQLEKQPEVGKTYISGMDFKIRPNQDLDINVKKGDRIQFEIMMDGEGIFIALHLCLLQY
jgi:hypothetical protein